MATDFIGILGTLVNIFPTYPNIYIGRFIIGIASGLNTAIVPLYIKEITPTSLIGLTSIVNPLVQDVGSFISFLFGLGYSSDPDK